MLISSKLLKHSPQFMTGPTVRSRILAHPEEDAHCLPATLTTTAEYDNEHRTNGKE